MKQLRKQTYNRTSDSIQILLNLASINGLLLVLILFILWDASTNLIALRSMFIDGFVRMAQGSVGVGNALCITFSFCLSVVIGLGILVMTLQIVKYAYKGSIPHIHKNAKYLSLVSGILSGLGYLELVIGGYKTFSSIPLSPAIVFHVCMAVAIAWVTPKAYHAIGVHIRMQFGSAINNFTDEVLDIAEEVSVEAFRKEAQDDKEGGKTVEERIVEMYNKAKTGS